MRAWQVAVAAVSMCMAVAAIGKSYTDYPEWQLLPKGDCGEDWDEIVAFQRLVDEGEAAHEAMLAVVRECDNMMFAQRALNVLRQTGGDKESLVAELKQLFLQRYPESYGEERVFMIYVAGFLADFGTEEDVKVLLPMLSAPGERTRLNGINFMKKRGGAWALEALEEGRTKAVKPTERAAFEEAIEAIRTRMEEAQ